MYKLLSFDVYGTLINTLPINVKAFRLILEQAGASNIDALAFYQFWGLCHGNGRGIEGRNGLIGSHAAATASDHCAAASALKIRRVDREIRWR